MNETGRKTFFWYRIYLAVLMVLYAAVSVLGIVLLLVKPDTRQYDQNEIFLVGVLYAAFGALFFVIFAAALFLPPKPYNWIVGLILICIGMTSCCFVPFLIPLIIFWVKPETKAFFGRT